MKHYTFVSLRRIFIFSVMISIVVSGIVFGIIQYSYGYQQWMKIEYANGVRYCGCGEGFKAGLVLVILSKRQIFFRICVDK